MGRFCAKLYIIDYTIQWWRQQYYESYWSDNRASNTEFTSEMTSYGVQSYTTLNAAHSIKLQQRTMVNKDVTWREQHLWKWCSLTPSPTEGSNAHLPQSWNFLCTTKATMTKRRFQFHQCFVYTGQKKWDLYCVNILQWQPQFTCTELNNFWFHQETSIWITDPKLYKSYYLCKIEHLNIWLNGADCSTTTILITTQQPIYRPFIQDEPGEPVPEKTYTHSHPVFMAIIQHHWLTLSIFGSP